ncbi:hypothetical protein ANTRET_LOCUS9893 [Anthophora retusa]
MYRQIRVHPNDSLYQRILFRKHPDEKINEFCLDTVTYGIRIRTLGQLADDEGNQHPAAAAVLKRDFYVDDLLTGANTRQEVAFLRDDLIALLQKGGFLIRKWASNPSLIPEKSGNPASMHMSLDPTSAVKTLGIYWNSREDVIFYKVNSPESSKPVTKRSILPHIAKLFDPLGLLGPIIVKAKITIQLLWKAEIS